MIRINQNLYSIKHGRHRDSSRVSFLTYWFQLLVSFRIFQIFHLFESSWFVTRKSDEEREVLS